jgi:hypothetical protein
MVQPRGRIGFFLVNAAVWVLMTVILVVVPDTLEHWMPIQVARVMGWTVACAVWVLAVEKQWQTRAGPFVRFLVQLVLWVSAALVAIWISDQARVTF